jgi:hypothetical protein
MIYGETLVIGLDLREVKTQRPRGVSEDTWWEQYKSFWPSWLNEHPHHSLFMFAHGMPPNTIVFGCRAEYFFTHYPEKSVVQFKKLVAREISKVLRIPVNGEKIQHFFVQYTLDEEDEHASDG